MVNTYDARLRILKRGEKQSETKMAMDGTVAGIEMEQFPLERIVIADAPKNRKERVTWDAIKDHMESVYQDWISQYALLEPTKIITKARKEALRAKLTEEMRAYTGRITSERAMYIDALEEQYVSRVHAQRKEEEQRIYKEVKSHFGIDDEVKLRLAIGEPLEEAVKSVFPNRTALQKKYAVKAAKKAYDEIERENNEVRLANEFSERVEAVVHQNLNGTRNKVKRELYTLLAVQKKETPVGMFEQYKAKVRYTIDNIDEMQAHVAVLYAPQEEISAESQEESYIEQLVEELRETGKANAPKQLVPVQRDAKGKVRSLATNQISYDAEGRELLPRIREEPVQYKVWVPAARPARTPAQEYVESPTELTPAETYSPAMPFTRRENRFFTATNHLSTAYYAIPLEEKGKATRQETSYKPAPWYQVAVGYAAAVVGAVVSAGAIVGGLTAMMSGFSANVKDFVESHSHSGKYAPQVQVVEAYHGETEAAQSNGETPYRAKAAHQKTAKKVHQAGASHEDIDNKVEEKGPAWMQEVARYQIQHSEPERAPLPEWMREMNKKREQKAYTFGDGVPKLDGTYTSIVAPAFGTEVFIQLPRMIETPVIVSEYRAPQQTTVFRF
ncbi:hypothetical protein HZA99_00270 [Candidatus Woesearchaeota archaeon]|nr:hypothetical protein [Candidatus Woesearchaeota archaeon]